MKRIKLTFVLVLTVVITAVLVFFFSGQLVDIPYGISQGSTIGSIVSALLITLMTLIVIPLSRWIIGRNH